MRVAAFMLACLPAAALGADILAAHYDPTSDALVVDIAYRGTHAEHDFFLQAGPCRDGTEVVARIIDRHGADAARRDFRARARFPLAGLDCRPGRITLRLGRVSHASVPIPRRHGDCVSEATFHQRGDHMKARMLVALAVAGLFAVPAVAHAQAGGPGGASAQGTGATGGAPRTGGPGPGSASMGEPQDFTGHPVGSPGYQTGTTQGLQTGATQGRAANFADLDRNNDGMITRAEWSAYAASASGASAGATDNPATVDQTPASSPRGTTAGPGTASERTGAGLPHATRPGTSGHGTPK